MKKDLVLKLRPDIEYVRKWVGRFETKHGKSDPTDEILRVLKYLDVLEEEFDRRELYLEALMKLTETEGTTDG